MRIVRNVIIATIIAICAFAGSVRADTLEEKISSLFTRQEKILIDTRVNENKACVPAMDASYGRTTATERQTCVDDHEEMINLSRKRFAKEIAWESAVNYNDSDARLLKRELDELINQGNAKIDELKCKYTFPRTPALQLKCKDTRRQMTTGQLK